MAAKVVTMSGLCKHLTSFIS